MNPLTWDAPWFIVAAGLFVGVMIRANATYWLGRGLAAGTSRSRHAALLQSAGYQKATGWLERWGAPVVTLSFLTIGIQTLVNLAAGAGRMSLARYLPAVTLGCMIWGVIYSTIGFVGFSAFSAIHGRSPLLAWGLLGAAVAALAAFVVIRVRQGRQGRGPASSLEADQAASVIPS